LRRAPRTAQHMVNCYSSDMTCCHEYVIFAPTSGAWERSGLPQLGKGPHAAVTVASLCPWRHAAPAAAVGIPLSSIKFRKQPSSCGSELYVLLSGIPMGVSPRHVTPPDTQAADRGEPRHLWARA
jgi:hypothetical protein